jgi:hypothetical protein
VLCTDSELALTWGNPAGAQALLSYLDLTRGSFTGVTSGRNGEVALIGQMLYTSGARSARISFLLPGDNLDQPSLPSLMESLAVQAGSWGASHLLAEVEESSPALDPVRHSGFSVYGWQTIWLLPNVVEARRSGPWHTARPSDDINSRTLYQQLVPPLVQAAEPFSPGKGPRLVYRQDDEILAYAEAAIGPQGIYVQPVIHPAVDDVESLLEGLIAQLPQTAGRPVYLAIRSHQAWLEPFLQRMDGKAAPRQALLVKHLAVLQRVSLLARKPAREAYNPEASVPLIQNTTIYKN